MGNSDVAKLRVRVGSYEVELEGSEAFLGAEWPKLLERMAATNHGAAAGYAELLLERAGFGQEIISELSQLRDEIGEMSALRLQMTMDRRSKLISTLSNLLKKISETSETIVQNLK